jgi:hypothetical protein
MKTATGRIKENHCPDPIGFAVQIKPESLSSKIGLRTVHSARDTLRFQGYKHITFN